MLISVVPGSLIVVGSALVVWLTDWEYKYYIDPALSIVLVILILASVWPLLRESSLILLQTVPTHIQVSYAIFIKCRSVYCSTEFLISKILWYINARLANLGLYKNVFKNFGWFCESKQIGMTYENIRTKPL